MKKLLLAAVLFASTAASAAPIDPSLQAVILAPQYAPAAAQAVHAVQALGTQRLVATLGQPHVARGTWGPEYYLHIPVLGVRVPLSPEKPVAAGEIVAELAVEPKMLREPIQ